MAIEPSKPWPRSDTFTRKYDIYVDFITGVRNRMHKRKVQQLRVDPELKDLRREIKEEVRQF